MIFTTTLLALAASLTLSTAKKHDVWSPKILTPTHGTQWYAGGPYNVTWDTSNPPNEITNSRGTIYLAQDGEILLTRELAHDFDLHKGYVEVHAPIIVSGLYQVVLFGDSGNLSEEFNIIYAQ